jgi:hypothetical protein
MATFAYTAMRIEHEEPLVERHVDRLAPGAFDRELGARLTEDRRRIIDALAGTRLNTQVDAALRISRRGTLRDRDGRSAQAPCSRDQIMGL